MELIRDKAGNITGGTSGNFAPPQAVSNPLPSSISPTIITSRAATDDMNRIKNSYTEANKGIQEQAARLATERAQADQARITKEQADADAKLAQDKLSIDKTAAEAKAAAVKGYTGSKNLVGTTPEEQNDVVSDEAIGDGSRRRVQYTDGTYDIVDAKSYTPLGKDQKKLAEAEIARDASVKEYQQKAAEVSKAITDIQNGVIPLNPAQNAQIQGLTNQWNQLIEQTRLSNIGASGIANIRGYQKGSAEYDPKFQASVIGDIVNKGNQTIMGYAAQAASDIAKLNEAFKENNIKAIKDSFTAYESSQEKHQKAVEDTIKETTDAIKSANDALIKLQEDRDKIAVEAAKNGAPRDVVNAISNANTIGQAVESAGDWLASGTGIVGEYLAYKRDASSRGLPVISFDDYATRDANRKIAATTGSSKYSANQEKVIQTVDNSIANNADYKRLQSMRTFKDNVIASLSKGTGVADIAAINQYQKVIDEGAVTRDQDIKILQSANSLKDRLLLEKKKLESGEQLSPEQRQDMRETMEELFATQLDSLKQNPFINSKLKVIERNGIDPLDTIIGELEIGGVGEEIIRDAKSIENEINAYVEANPLVAETVASLFESGESLENIREYLNLK